MRKADKWECEKFYVGERKEGDKGTNGMKEI